MKKIILTSTFLCLATFIFSAPTEKDRIITHGWLGLVVTGAVISILYSFLKPKKVKTQQEKNKKNSEEEILPPLLPGGLIDSEAPWWAKRAVGLTRNYNLKMTGDMAKGEFNAQNPIMVYCQGGKKLGYFVDEQVFFMAILGKTEYLFIEQISGNYFFLSSAQIKEKGACFQPHPQSDELKKAIIAFKKREDEPANSFY